MSTRQSLPHKEGWHLLFSGIERKWVVKLRANSSQWCGLHSAVMSDPNKANTRRGWRMQGVGTGFAPNLSVSSPDTNLVSKHTAIMSPHKQWCNSQRVNKWSCMESHRSFWCNSLSARGESCLGCFCQGGFLCLGRLGVFHLCPTLFLGWKCAEKIFQRGLLNLSLLTIVADFFYDIDKKLWGFIPSMCKK